MTMNFRQIISQCYFDKNSLADPKVYFERVFKKAEREECFTADDFFNRCQLALDSFKQDIKSSYERQLEIDRKKIESLRKGNGYYLPPPGGKPFSDYGEEYQKETRKRQLEIWEAHLKNLSIEKVKLSEHEPLTLKDISIIEAGLKDAFQKLSQNRSEQTSSRKPLTSDCSLTDEQLNKILNLVKEIKLFKEPFEIVDLKSLFYSSKTKIYYVNNNQNLACLFNYLQPQFITANWKRVIENNKCLKGLKDQFLTANNLSVSLNNVKYHTDDSKKIKNVITNL